MVTDYNLLNKIGTVELTLIGKSLFGDHQINS